MPTGWHATTQAKKSTFKVLILTDVEGKPSYLACLCFYECISRKVETSSLNINLKEDSNLKDVEKAIRSSGSFVEENFYVPKCLCVVSRHRYYTTLKVSVNVFLKFHALKIFHVANERRLLE